MRGFRTLLLLFLLFWALPSDIVAQYLSVRHLNRENSMPTQAVNDIARDSSGAIWMATNIGLFRYDGLNYERIRLYSQQNKEQLNQVKLVMIDRSGVIYLAFVNNGFGVLQEDGRLTHYKGYQADTVGLRNALIDDIVDLEDRVLLIFERNGFAFFHKEKKTFTYYVPTEHFDQLEKTMRMDIVYKGVADPLEPRDAWLTGVGGVYHWNHRTQEVSLYPLDPSFSTQPPSNEIYLHTDRKLYMGGWGKGLHIFDTRQLCWERRVASASGVDLSLITAIAPLSSEELWLCTRDYGIYSYHIPTSTCSLLLPLYKDLDASAELNHNIDAVVYKVMPIGDRSWCLMKAGRQGLAFVYRERQLFQKYQTGVSMHHLVAGKGEHDYLITNQPFFFKRHRKTAQLEQIAIARHLDDTGFKSGFLGPDKAFYIAGWRGLYRYDERARLARLKYLPVYDSLTRSDTDIQILSSFNQKDELIWLGTRRGLHRIKVEQSGWKEKWFTFFDTIPGSPPAKMVWFNDVHATPDGRLWTVNDVSVMMSADRGKTFSTFRQSDFQKSGVGIADFMTLAHDDNGRLWLGGVGEGLGYFNWRENGISAYYPLIMDKNAPLLSEVSDMTRDLHGNIWGIFQEGLFRLDAGTLEVQTFGKEFGLPEGGLFALDTVPGGQMYLGTEGGYFLFHPDSVLSSVSKPLVSVWQAYLIGMAEPDTLRGGQDLLLKYPQNGVQLRLAVQPFWLTARLHLRYRLIEGGQESDWTYLDNNNLISFWNMPPGNYRIEIQVADALGNYWPESTLEVKMEVLAAWWQTWWFRGLVLLILVGGLLGYLYRRQRAIQAELQFKKRLTELELASLRAQINPHFIFNSLNTVKWQVINGDRQTAEAYLDLFSTLVRRVLDYSTQSLISLEDEVDFLLQYVEMEQIRFKDAFVFQLELPDASDWTMIEVPPLVLQPYVENAIRHGLLPKAGKDKQIWLTIGLKEGYCHIHIRDNGIGRAAAQAARGSVDLLRTSRGMQISSDRFAGLSSTIFSDFRFEVNDLHDETGRPSGTEIHLSFQYLG